MALFLNMAVSKGLQGLVTCAGRCIVVDDLARRGASLIRHNPSDAMLTKWVVIKLHSQPKHTRK
jgi:hypothetical protein